MTLSIARGQSTQLSIPQASTFDIVENSLTQSSRIRTGGWVVGDPIGDRKFAELGTLELESGENLEVALAYESWGKLNAAADNAVLIMHALTGDSHVCGSKNSAHPGPGWWDHLVGPGKPVDTNKYFVVAPNILGGCQGSTGPSSTAADGKPYGSRFPFLTTRDQVKAEYLLTQHLGIATWHAVIGGSMGGMRVLEWACTYPAFLKKAVVIASAAKASADVLAWNSAQLAAIETSPGYRGGDYYLAPKGNGPEEALAVARQIAHITYRSAAELNCRFDNLPQTGEDPLRNPEERFQITSYLDHHGQKLVNRFDAGSYVRLVKAMNTHDVGRGRGGVELALQKIQAQTLVIGVDTDRLFPASDSEFLAEHIPNSRLHIIHSDCGHDGFLINEPNLNTLIRDFVEK